MAKSNPERLALEALRSPSAASSSSLMADQRPSQSPGVGAFADGPNLGSANSPSVERATSRRQASTSPRCAFSWVQDYAHRPQPWSVFFPLYRFFLHNLPSASPFLKAYDCQGWGHIGENRRFGIVLDQCAWLWGANGNGELLWRL